MRRPVFFLAIALLAGLTVGLLLAGSPETTACRAEPTSDCLIERALAVHDGSLHHKLNQVLQEMGRFETLDALMAAKGGAHAEPGSDEPHDIMQQRLTRGEAWRDVLTDIDRLDAGELWLLGSSVFRMTPQNSKLRSANAPEALDAVIAEMQRRRAPKAFRILQA